MNKPMVTCPKCRTMAPAGTDVCPECGARLPSKLGYLSDDQIKRVRKPLNIICWAAVIIIILIKFFM